MFCASIRATLSHGYRENNTRHFYLKTLNYENKKKKVQIL